MNQSIEQFAVEQAKLAENVRASEYAVEVVQMCGIQPPRFWECLKALCENRLPAAKPVVEQNPPMTEPQAAKFELEPFPYGKHADEEVRDVPVDYLLFIVEGDEFTNKLKSYVKSKRFQDRQNFEDPE